MKGEVVCGCHKGSTARGGGEGREGEGGSGMWLSLEQHS